MRRADEMSGTCARDFSQEGSGEGDDSAELAKMIMSKKSYRLCQRVQDNNKKKADASGALRQKRRKLRTSDGAPCFFQTTPHSTYFRPKLSRPTLYYKRITVVSWPVAAPPAAASALAPLPHAASPRRTMAEPLGSPSSPCESSAVAATPETAAAAARLQLAVDPSRPSQSA